MKEQEIKDMPEYICDDREDLAELVKKIQNMSNEEFEKFLNEV